MPWTFARATTFEQRQLLRAMFPTGTAPVVAAQYWLGISTTLPDAAGTVTELSPGGGAGGYARAAVTAWAVPGVTSAGALDTTFPGGQQTIFLAYACPAANVAFPAPAAGASWWSPGATIYPFAADAATGGNVRWWWTIVAPPVPAPSAPFVFASTGADPTSDPLGAIACGLQQANNDGSTNPVRPLMSSVISINALQILTGADPLAVVYPYWLAVGWGPFYWGAGGTHTPGPTGFVKEPSAPISLNWRSWTDGFDYNNAGLKGGTSTLYDAAYARRAVTFYDPVAGGDGRLFVANSSDLVFTLGNNTVSSGDPMPDPALGNEQLTWTGGFFQLHHTPTLAYGDLGAAPGGCFTFFNVNTGGIGGPPNNASGIFGEDVRSGLLDEGGNVLGYLHFDTPITAPTGPILLAVSFSYLKPTEFDSVGTVPDATGSIPVTIHGGFMNDPSLAYTRYFYYRLFEQQNDGTYLSNDSMVFDPAVDYSRDYAAWLAGGSFGAGGGYGYYVPGGYYWKDYLGNVSADPNPGSPGHLKPEHIFLGGGPDESFDISGHFLVGDTVKIPAGSLAFRVR